jgi:hypothetical protein
VIRRLAQVLLGASSAIIVVAGVAVAMAGFDKKKDQRTKSQRRWESRRNLERATRRGAQGKERTDYFEIRRTQSELGYTYWILKGHGIFQCFELFDSWEEATAQLKLRTEQASSLGYR